MSEPCPFGCAHDMSTPRREGETDLQWWDRERGRDYHGTHGSVYGYCPGHAAHRAAWEIEYYGISPRPEERTNEKVIVTLEVEVDLEYYHRPKAISTLRRDLNMDYRYDHGGLPAAIMNGSVDWRITNRTVKSVRKSK